MGAAAVKDALKHPDDKAKLKHAFFMADANHDGRLSKAEFKTVAQGYADYISKKGGAAIAATGSIDRITNMLFDSADYDGDGKVTWDEFESFIKNFGR